MSENPENGQSSFAGKKIDETWKETVHKEKSVPPEEGGAPELPSPDFAFFVTALGMQALLVLGEIEDASGKRAEPDLKQAQYLIDVIQMLSDKTAGNLTKEESAVLQNLLYELRMKFVQKSQSA